jgi:hypothetical protein
MKLRKKEVQQIEEDLDLDIPEDSSTNDDELKDDMDDLGFDDFGGDDFGGEGGQTPLEKHNDLLKELTNFDPYLKETFNNWLGITWDEDEQKFKRNSLLKPMMSFQGATFGAGTLKTYARRNNIITDISFEEYKNMMCDHIDAVWLNFGTRDDLGVFDDGDLLRVCNELEHAAMLVLMGAGEGKYNKMLGTTYSHHTTGNDGQGMMGHPRPVEFGHKKPSVLDKARNFLIGSGDTRNQRRTW